LTFCDFREVLTFCDFREVLTFCDFREVLTFCAFREVLTFCDFREVLTFCDFREVYRMIDYRADLQGTNFADSREKSSHISTGWRRLIGSLIVVGHFRKSNLYLVALLWKMICNLGDPMSLRHPIVDLTCLQ